MTNTYSPELTAGPPTQQIINSIYYWINQNTWAPGIAFPAGPTNPTTGMHEKDFFYNTTNSHLWQYQDGDYPSGQWIDLGTAANAITWCGTTLPESSSEGALFNKYDEGKIYQWITVNDIGGWRNIGSNADGLPLGADAITFTDLSKTWRSARLGMILTVEGASPLLATDVGLVVKKDITAGGFIGTNQGEVWIGHGQSSQDDKPKIIMMHSEQTYDTLYLTQLDRSTPAHLDLVNLNVHGMIDMNSNIALYRPTTGTQSNQHSLRIQTPIDGGVIVEQSLWAKNMAVDDLLGVGGDLAVDGNAIVSGTLEADVLRIPTSPPPGSPQNGDIWLVT
ncbi:MAG: hypothetical protein ACFCUE_08900 [Candidatus Bathyarchaeia archaeon]|jgi:hypothetical protein